MKKSDKILVLFYVALAISLVIVFASIDYSFNHLKSVDIVPVPLTEFEIVKTVDVSKEKLFNIMASVKDYPKILPKNVVSIKIIEQKSNEILAEEELMELGIKTKVLVKHTFLPYERQIIEIIEGDAAGTKIILEFEDVDGSTKLVSSAELHLKGIFTPFSFIPEANLSHALNTVISSFVVYAKSFDSTYEKTVDDLYREILFRPADNEGLNHYSKLLETGKLNENELREILLSSEERKNLTPQEFKNVDELQETTKIIIESIYEEMLHREPDSDGLIYFGSLLEANKITEKEIRQRIFESEEGLAIRLEQPGAYTVDDLFREILNRSATQDELDHFAPLLYSKNMTKFELREIIEKMN